MASQHQYRSGIICAALFAAALAVTHDAQAGGDPAAGREKAKVCRTCHGMDGVGKLPNVPNIGGESDFYLTKQLKAFRKGDRRDEQTTSATSGSTGRENRSFSSWSTSCLSILVNRPSRSTTWPSIITVFTWRAFPR